MRRRYSPTASSGTERGKNPAKVIVDSGAVPVKFRELLPRSQFIIGRNISANVSRATPGSPDILWIGKRDLHSKRSFFERFDGRVRRQLFHAAEDRVARSRSIREACGEQRGLRQIGRWTGGGGGRKDHALLAEFLQIGRGQIRIVIPRRSLLHQPLSGNRRKKFGGKLRGAGKRCQKKCWPVDQAPIIKDLETPDSGYWLLLLRSALYPRALRVCTDHTMAHPYNRSRQLRQIVERQGIEGDRSDTVKITTAIPTTSRPAIPAGFSIRPASGGCGRNIVHQQNLRPASVPEIRKA